MNNMKTKLCAFLRDESGVAAIGASGSTSEMAK